MEIIFIDDEKPLELRDKLAIEIFNGILAHSKNDTGSLIIDIVHHINYDEPDSDRIEKNAARRIERVVQACYKVADIMRKVRLSAFK